MLRLSWIEHASPVGQGAIVRDCANGSFISSLASQYLHLRAWPYAFHGAGWVRQWQVEERSELRVTKRER